MEILWSIIEFGSWTKVDFSSHVEQHLGKKNDLMRLYNYFISIIPHVEHFKSLLNIIQRILMDCV